MDTFDNLDPVDREIAILMHRDELTDMAAGQDTNDRVGIALERAKRQGNYSSLRALEREVDRANEEDDFLLIAVAILNY